MNTKPGRDTKTEKKRPEPETAMDEGVQLNDNTIRWIGIPFFGIIIPNISGLFVDLSFHSVTYWLGYPYFISLAAMIWQGNRYLLFRTRQRFTWFDKPIEKLILLFVNNIFYTTPLTVAWICMWYRWASLGATNWEVVAIVSLINVICVLFVTHVYETVFLVKEQESELVKNEQLQRAKAEAELEALKNQIDPHFMFNSLNSLSYLIKKDQTKAALFTDNLAEVYRYILSQKDESLVLLEDEFNFVNKYTELLQLRFGNALIIHKNYNGTTEKEFLIPPISAFVAMENVVKHNEISERAPLHVDISVDDGQLVIRNKVREKRSIHHSSRIGLRNLDERFKILTGKGITSTNDDGYFTVRMPLVNLSN